jgi:hypothetical protein
MQNQMHNKKASEKAHISKLCLSYRVAMKSGGDLQSYSNRKLHERITDLQTLLNDHGPSEWFQNLFVGHSGNYGGIQFTCARTNNGYKIRVEKIAADRGFANAVA